MIIPFDKDIFGKSILYKGETSWVMITEVLSGYGPSEEGRILIGKPRTNITDGPNTFSDIRIVSEDDPDFFDLGNR